MSTAIDISQLISRDPKIRDGRPCIAGTGVSIMRIAGYHKIGISPEEIADEYEHLSLAQVYAALAYYHANEDEIELDLRTESELAEELAKQHRRERTDKGL